ncbi:MAG: DUF2723 domain-containing protein [Ignavibacteriae bacterium]|nr:DUF2723 domain-containing protein [Ignavibacteriota bacterium]
MNQKYVYHGFGIVAFLITLITLLITVQPTVPFWDCGEFSAASIWQQVPHPPGAPLFLMIGKVFHTIIPFGDQGWRINLVSVFSGAFTIWFLYLITVKAIVYMRKEKTGTLSESLAIYASAFVGAVAFGFSDTFWFNAVESEVYAMSNVFVAVIVYLMMNWNEEADRPGNERYILVIAYLIGLSTGVHLLSILTIFSIIMLIYFRKYKLNTQSFIVMGVISILIFFLIYPGIIKWVPAFLGGDLPFKNECKEAIIKDSPMVTVFFILIVLGAIATLWYSYKNNKPILNLSMFSFLLLLFGYSTYTQILLRSNSNSPMNENEPKNMNSLVSYLGREQYGEAPNWPRRYQTDDEFIVHYNEKDDKGEFVYGQWNPPIREEVQCNDEGGGIMVPKFKDVNTGGELSYMFKYQIYHMYYRYFLWNFVGRSSDVQDADYSFSNTAEAKSLNYKSGYANLFPVRFYALPLLIGLIGLFFHFWKDPKTALVFFIMFLLMGVLAAIAQNQQNPQPRERDYFYAGSFMVWCMWIGFGVYGLIDWVGKRKFTTPVVSAIAAISFIAVPFNMAMGGWKIHSRAGNYIPFDYSYNILQSTEQNAIIFTNGDNDTFPVWFLQDVEGVRRDVRVVNLSLGNTLWYVHQLKHRNPWGAGKIPLSFRDESLTVSETDPAALTYELGEAQNVEIPVKQDIMAKYTNDPQILADPKMRFTFVGKYYGVRENKKFYIFRVQDKLVFDILKQVKFTRPVYFSTTVGPDAFCGLEKFFRYEGMAARICPVEQKEAYQKPIDTDITEKCLMRIDNSNNYHKEPYYGFKLRNLNNPDVFYDEVHRRLIPNYRELYMNFASTVLKDFKNPQKATAILDTMNKYLSPTQFPMTYEYEFKLSNLYHDAGAKEQFRKYAMMSIKSSEEIINNNKISSESIYGEIMGNYYGPYRISSILYSLLGDFTSAKTRLQELFRKTSAIYDQIQNNPAYKDEVQKVAMNLYNVTMTLDEYTIDEVKQKQGMTRT